MIRTHVRRPRRNIWLAFALALAVALAPWSAAAEDEAAPQPTVTNVFVDTYITEALRDVAFETGVNIITDTSVQGFVTLDLVEVPLEEALNQILLPGGYTFTKLDEKTYLVGRADPGSPMFHLLSETQRYKFQYIQADSARRLMPQEYNPYVKFDAQTNSALVQASPQQVKRILADLAKIDVPPRQIIVEALVTEISSSARKRLGIDWSFNGPGTNFAENFFSFRGLVGNVGYLLGPDFDRFLIDLHTLVDDGQAKIRANSRVAALDGGEANLFVGQQRYYKIETGSETNPFTRLQPIDAGVSLTIRPQVAANGDITLFIEPSVSDVNGTNKEGLPEIYQRNVATTVRVKSGQTIAIGGLVQETENMVVSKVPLLGDLPILSHLFSSTMRVREETEVLIFITPRLMEEE